MPPRGRQSTVRLPQTLRDEIEAQGSEFSKPVAGRKRTPNPVNRKAERKAERQRAKQRKLHFFSHNPSNPSVGSAGATEQGGEDKPYKKRKLQSSPTSKPVPPEVTYLPEVKPPNRPKEKLLGLSTSNQAGNAGIVKLKGKRPRRETEEDAYISLLEKRLGIDKRKNAKSRYGAGFEGDGLLDLLVDLDERVLDDVGEEDQTDEEDTGLESEASAGPGFEASHTDEEDVWTGFVSEESSDVEENETGIRNRDVDEQALASKYVPPHLRKLDSVSGTGGDEVDAKLIRLLKGLLNRMSEQNIDTILKEIEGLYRSHRRHDITTTLTNLIIEGTCSHSILLDSYVALHAGLVACLHKIIGVELAAHFVQTVVATFERHYKKYSETPAYVDSKLSDEPSGKECSNLLILLSDLYNYHVISCTLMYDIIRLILNENLSELDVELILKLARGSGFQLRQDDPSALKDIIQIVQSKLGDQHEASSRTRFMLETLNNIKNNKLKKNIAAAQGSGESKERITKFVAGIGKKYHVHAQEALRISLDDLHQADTKGKWWLVGAAWGGDPLLDQKASRDQGSYNQAGDADNALLKLAKKQGMNTDVRRSVFVVLMSSDDYVDACDRLAQLNLTDVQQREIIRVLLHCCGNEKAYNPYYTLIGQHLCRQSHSHRVTLQYCFWDFLRGLGELNVGSAEMAKSFEDDNDENQSFDLDRVSSTRVANVARAFAWWVAKDSVAITILKTLDFVTLKTKTQIFLTHLFTHLFACTQDPSPVPSLSSSLTDNVLTMRNSKVLEEVLLKAARVPDLAMGILHFLSASLRQTKSQNQKMDSFVLWGCDTAKDALQNMLETGRLE
ncbi:hypothetical protein M0805_009846 [Coniferiporia weirii]|nr:hypothetical protein M0805_009846 [Coniferiporia weirii]